MAKESVYIRKELNSQKIGLKHQHGRRLVVLGHQPRLSNDDGEAGDDAWSKRNYIRNCNCLDLFSTPMGRLIGKGRLIALANGSQNVLRLNMQRQRSVPNGNTKN